MTPYIEDACRAVVATGGDPAQHVWFDVSHSELQSLGRLELVPERLPFPSIAIVVHSIGGEELTNIIQATETEFGISYANSAIFEGRLDGTVRFNTEKGQLSTEVRSYNVLAVYLDNLPQDVQPDDFLRGLQDLGMMACKTVTDTKHGQTARSIVRRRWSKNTVKGRHLPIFEWKTVEIAPAPPRQEPKGGTHASPRLHDRRGFYRVSKLGKKHWVNSCKVGSAKAGIIFHDYKVKQQENRV